MKYGKGPVFSVNVYSPVFSCNKQNFCNSVFCLLFLDVSNHPVGDYLSILQFLIFSITQFPGCFMPSMTSDYLNVFCYLQIYINDILTGLFSPWLL